MKKHYCIFYILLFFVCSAKAQDAQYSQYYNAPLFLNPAFAGTADNSRAILNYRNQWPGLNQPYNTYSLSLDHRIEPINSGVGLIVRRDEQGDRKLSATEVGVVYSYMVPIAADWTFIPAVQASWINRSLNYSDLVFGDQIDVNDPNSLPGSNDRLATDERTNFADFSAGGLVFSKNFWFGASVNHLNTPDQSFAGGQQDQIPIKSTFNFGYKFSLHDPYKAQGDQREISITPTFLYKTQGRFDQLDVGVYGIYAPLMLGVWYRGLPLKRYSAEFSNHDAIVLLAGVNVGGLTFSYSYDITISSLSQYSSGAHEISLIFEWLKPYQVKRKRKPLPCPKFYNGRLKN